jgi:hypothetical protein
VETREVKTKKQGSSREDDEEDGWSRRAIGDQEEDGWDDENSVLEWRNEGRTRERAFQSDHHGLR